MGGERHRDVWRESEIANWRAKFRTAIDHQLADLSPLGQTLDHCARTQSNIYGYTSVIKVYQVLVHLAATSARRAEALVWSNATHDNEPTETRKLVTLLIMS